MSLETVYKLVNMVFEMNEACELRKTLLGWETAFVRFINNEYYDDRSVGIQVVGEIGSTISED